MGYYLLENRNPNKDMFYPTRLKTLVGMIVHCTAGLEDKDMIGPDHSAEKTALYAATTSRSVSWHSGSDSDTVLELLPASYTAWQCHGYNSTTYGHEISKRHMVWEDEPADWVTATLELAAGHMAKIARENGIPLRKITKAQLDRAIAAGDPSMGGFVGHRELDPTRRTDPGADFPWERFINLMKNSGNDQGGLEDMTPEEREALLNDIAEKVWRRKWNENTSMGQLTARASEHANAARLNSLRANQKTDQILKSVKEITIEVGGSETVADEVVRRLAERLAE